MVATSDAKARVRRVPGVTQRRFVSRRETHFAWLGSLPLRRLPSSLSRRQCEGRWVGSEYSGSWGGSALQHSVVQIHSLWPPQLPPELGRTTASVDLSTRFAASNHATGNVLSEPPFLALDFLFSSVLAEWFTACCWMDFG